MLSPTQPGLVSLGNSRAKGNTKYVGFRALKATEVWMYFLTSDKDIDCLKKKMLDEVKQLIRRIG